MGPVCAGGAMIQPMRHPVQLYVLDNDEIVIVRSRMPGQVAISW